MSPWAFLIVIDRFFVRSCLETSIQYKWMVIRDALDKYFYISNKNPDKSNDAEKFLEEAILLYHFKWKSPRKLKKIIWDNLRLAYLWPFIVLIVMIVWCLYKVPLDKEIITTLIIVSAYMVYEICTFFTYRGFRFKSTEIERPML